MKLFIFLEKWLRALFPSTFTLAIALTVLTFILALFLTEPVIPGSFDNPFHKELANEPLAHSSNHLLQLAGFWYNGLWQGGLLAFAIQMMLILVLGYVLASTEVFKRFISSAMKYCTNTAKAALLVTFFTLLLSLFNWGLGLIFGAVFAKKVAEHSRIKGFSLNYPLIAAAGYSGLMIWHGGISGSAPLKVAEPGHLAAMSGMDLPPIDFSETVFSPMNLTISLSLLIILPLILYFIGKKVRTPENTIYRAGDQKSYQIEEKATGAERIDHSSIFSIILGAAFLILALYKAILTGNLGVIDPNYLNFILLGLGILMSKNIAAFLASAKNATGAASGILIQFPLYFGIMGIMKYSGLIEVFSGFLVSISSPTTFPLFTFFSAGLVNIFIPSGGGQWAVQGPIIIEAAENLNVPLSKAVIALAYGDQITNMLQPFWALPLLGITGLRVRDIIPYTLLMMMTGIVVFIAGLLLL